MTGKLESSFTNEHNNPITIVLVTGIASVSIRMLSPASKHELEISPLEAAHLRRLLMEADFTAAGPLAEVREICIRGHWLVDGVDTGEHDFCVGMGCNEPNEAGGSYRTKFENCADVGESLLRKSATWKPAEDTDGMTAPQMIQHIYKNRLGHAVAPNGHTTPFLTVEEWTRIAEWAATSAEIATALKIAVGHIEHMAAFFGNKGTGYSFEALGEDMPGIREALAKAGASQS